MISNTTKSNKNIQWIFYPEYSIRIENKKVLLFKLLQTIEIPETPEISYRTIKKIWWNNI
jgi:hypothetical protein